MTMKVLKMLLIIHSHYATVQKEETIPNWYSCGCFMQST